MQKLTVEYIKESGEFRPFKELRFSEVLSFVLENIRVANWVTVFFLVINIVFFWLLVGHLAFVFLKNGFSNSTFEIFSTGLFWGIMTGSIFIIPMHEGLHALGFLLKGAKKIRFGADMSQMIVYATAEDFVAGKKSLFFYALAPFVVINLVSLPFMIFGSFETRIFYISMLLLHNLMCIGDFGMMSFFVRYKEKELYTFDDLETKTAWFYERGANVTGDR
jgi:hypothetical protein